MTLRTLARPRLAQLTRGQRADLRALGVQQLDDIGARITELIQMKPPEGIVAKLSLLPKLLDHEDGELTATQKVKRNSLEEMFGDLIESMY